MLARLAELDVRPALERELQVDASRREINQRARVIEREVVVPLLAKLLELLRVLILFLAIDPARSEHVDVVESRLHAVLVLQAERHDVELQRTDRSENQIVVT